MTFVVRGNYLCNLTSHKAVLVHAAHLAATMPGRCDVQWNDILDHERGWSARAYVSRIEPVFFFKSAQHTIVLRHATAATLDWKPE